ncbi:hypothetical protein Dimus_011756 [Dionaea muscipula]
MQGDESCHLLGGGDNSRGETELERLEKEYEVKTSRIQELRTQIQGLRTKIENINKLRAIDVVHAASGREKKIEAFKALTEMYNTLRDEYNALLAVAVADKSQDHEASHNA